MPAEPGEPAILCRGVVKRFYHYEHRTASIREFFIRAVLGKPIHVRRAEFTLRDLNLRVEKGESLAMVGPNGSGKSTALRLIAGVYTPSEGVVLTRGRVAAVIELGVGFHPELTGAENVSLYASVVGLRPAELAARYAEILEFAGVGSFIDEPIKYYSSGMTARLAFAVVVCLEPDVLLLDEVLVVGDEAFRRRCLDHLHGFKARGGTLIVVSHELDLVRELCPRALWLDRGRTLMDGATDEVLAAYQAEAAAGNAGGL